jgi:hypothetical protein
MKDIQVTQVIVSNQLTRGNGSTDPIRRVLQIFDFEGNLIAENDPETFTMMDLVHFGNYVAQTTINNITPAYVRSWLDNANKGN